MSTEKFTYASGSQVGVTEQDDGSGMLLVGGSPTGPDVKWVTLPEELGGGRVGVQGRELKSCPSGCEQHWTLILPDGIGVMDCPVGGFLWVRIPPKDPREMSIWELKKAHEDLEDLEGEGDG